MSNRSLKTVLNEDDMENITMTGDMVTGGDMGVVGDFHADGHMCFYGEFATIDNANATTINAQDQWHSVYNDVVTGELHGFTYADGSAGVIASIADAGSGDVTINDVAHGLSAGAMITITGTTNYNGVYEVKTVATDSFTVTATWGADEAGQWQQGASLTCTESSAPGFYRGVWSASGISETINHVFDFAPCLNTTVAGKAKARRKFSNVDYGNFGGTAFMEIALNDVIHFVVQNTTGTGNVTIRTRDMNLTKM